MRPSLRQRLAHKVAHLRQTSPRYPYACPWMAVASQLAVVPQPACCSTTGPGPSRNGGSTTVGVDGAQGNIGLATIRPEYPIGTNGISSIVPKSSCVVLMSLLIIKTVSLIAYKTDVARSASCSGCRHEAKHSICNAYVANRVALRSFLRSHADHRRALRRPVPSGLNRRRYATVYLTSARHRVSYSPLIGQYLA